jgi:hypothetical protein
MSTEEEVTMSDHQPTGEAALRSAVKVSVDPEKVAALAVGTRWEVEGFTLASLWHPPHTVTLRRIEGSGGTGGAR